MYVRRRLVVAWLSFRHRFVVGSPSLRHRLVVAWSSFRRLSVVVLSWVRRHFVVLSSSVHRRAVLFQFPIRLGSELGREVGKQKKTKGWKLHRWPCTRGHCLPLRLTFPPLRTPHGFACSVASLSQCPCHYQPGHHSFRCAALVECPLGQGKPST